MNVALAIIGAFLALALGLGLVARRGKRMSLEQWTVGGRSFGTVLVFLLTAGEIYTTFSFLGASGWAYGKGAAAFYILCYLVLNMCVWYFLAPAVWRYGTAHGLVSVSDWFASKYRSRALGVVVALVGVAAMVPYLVLQLKGLGIIVSEASYGSVSPAAAVWAGSAALVAYVVVSGVHGSAWTAAAKDLAIVIVAVALGVWLPLHAYGSYAAMFRAVEHAKPGLLTLPAKGMSVSWFISTVLLSTLGLAMWPHVFGSIFTARSARVFRRNAVVMPLYQLMLLFVLFVGFAAILLVPGLQGADADLSLLRASKATLSPVAIGIIGGAGVLTALVPGSMLLIHASATLARNVYQAAFPRARERTVALLARALVPAVALLATWLTLRPGNALVPLLLMGYNLVTQLFPGVVLSLRPVPLASRAGVFAGIIAGEATVAWLTISGATLAKLFPAWPAAVTDINVGFVALIVNVAVLAAVSAATQRSFAREMETAPRVSPTPEAAVR
jgi:SSS family solute:Na+ symporter